MLTTNKARNKTAMENMTAAIGVYMIECGVSLEDTMKQIKAIRTNDAAWMVMKIYYNWKDEVARLKVAR